MDSIVQTQNNDFDDGFSAPYRMRCAIAKWNDQKGWHDGDGLPLPSPMLVVGVDTLLLKWHPQREEIRTKPLPDPALLNSAIPVSEWRTGLDGQPESPWKLNWEIRMVDPATGTPYVFANSTRGTHRCWEELYEAVSITRALRGAKVIPLVQLDKRPMPTNFGMKSRPHLYIVDWRQPLGQDSAPSLPTPPAQLPPAAPSTVEAMAPIKPIPIEEFVEDEIPF
jgi:hypothetical protein